MKRDLTPYLRDILENMRDAQEFVGDLSYDRFISDKKTFYAVVRCMEIIGEATKNVPPSVRKKYPDIPWREMAGMRDKVIHEYFGVDREAVWLAVKERIPEIGLRLEQALRDLEGR